MTRLGPPRAQLARLPPSRNGTARRAGAHLDLPGADRLAPPIIEHEPDLVLHGHAHAGTFEGRLGEIPVFDVSVPVLGRDFWELGLTVAERVTSAIH